MRGGVHRYAAQARPEIDTAGAQKDLFPMETNYKFCILAGQCDFSGWGGAK
ncbi:MAG: hypothetical protein ABSH17_02450 [Syntrophobacteraceae bacterium]